MAINDGKKNFKNENENEISVRLHSLLSFRCTENRTKLNIETIFQFYKIWSASLQIIFNSFLNVIVIIQTAQLNTLIF